MRLGRTWANMCSASSFGLVVRLQYEDGHKKVYGSRRNLFGCPSFKTKYTRQIDQAQNPSCASLYTR